MFKTLPQGFHHKRGRAEIHIRHPHGEEVIASPYTLHTVPFHGVGTTALYYFIKIVSHMLAFYNSTHQFVLFYTTHYRHLIFVNNNHIGKI